MLFKHQGKEYDMPVKKFKDRKSAVKAGYAKALENKKGKKEKDMC